MKSWKFVLPVLGLLTLALSWYLSTRSPATPVKGWPWATSNNEFVTSVFSYVQAPLGVEDPDREWIGFEYADALTLAMRTGSQSSHATSGRIAFKAKGRWYFGSIHVDCPRSTFRITQLSAWRTRLFKSLTRVKSFQWPSSRTAWQQGDVEDDTVLRFLCQQASTSDVEQH